MDFPLSRLSDVAEDIFRIHELASEAEVPDINKTIATLRIHVPKTRHLGAVTATLKKSLRKNGLQDIATISKT